MKRVKLTDFEKQVYYVVSRIPLGEVRSYKWVAAKIGRPRAYRAVGNALHKNPFAPIIPCHRVIKSDGSIGGFARGKAAKNRLIKREREIIRFIKGVKSNSKG